MVIILRIDGGMRGKKDEEAHLGLIITPCCYVPFSFYPSSLSPPLSGWAQAGAVRVCTYLKGRVMDWLVSTVAQAKQLYSGFMS
jgi:hypothetical protein